jgi:hypothetical protein
LVVVCSADTVTLAEVSSAQRAEAAV